MKKILDFIYAAGSMVGSAIVASNTGFNTIGYVIFIAASSSGAIITIREKAPKSFLLVNVYFFIVNIVGVIRA